MKLWSETYINQTKIVLIDWKLFRTNLFLQSWGIGALEKPKAIKYQYCNFVHSEFN